MHVWNLWRVRKYGWSNDFKRKLNYTIDLLITMVTDEIAEETGKNRNEVLTDFLCSKTGKALYDEKTKLWCNGPSYIADLYMEELKNGWYAENASKWCNFPPLRFACILCVLILAAVFLSLFAERIAFAELFHNLRVVCQDHAAAVFLRRPFQQPFKHIVLHDELRRYMLLCRFVLDKGFQLHRIFCNHSKTSMYRSTLGFTRSWSAYCISLWMFLSLDAA